MSKIKLRLKSPLKLTVVVFLLVVSLQIASLIGQYFAHQSSIQRAIDVVERRISLDSAFLDVGNETLNTPENRYTIGRYIERLNRVIEEAQLPVIVSEIQGVPTKLDASAFPVQHRTKFQNAEQTIDILVNNKAPVSELSVSWLSLLLALLVAPLFAFTNRKKRVQSKLEELVLPHKPKLVINLQEKTISNGIDDRIVT